MKYMGNNLSKVFDYYLSVHINRETWKRFPIGREEIHDLYAKTSQLLKDSYRAASRVKGLDLTEFDYHLLEEAKSIVSLICRGELELAYLLKGSVVNDAVDLFQSRSFGQGILPDISRVSKAA